MRHDAVAWPAHAWKAEDDDWKVCGLTARLLPTGKRSRHRKMTEDDDGGEAGRYHYLNDG